MKDSSLELMTKAIESLETKLDESIENFDNRKINYQKLESFFKKLSDESNANMASQQALNDTMVAAKEKSEALDTKISDLSEKLPVRYNTTIHFDKESRYEILKLLFIFCFIITASVLTIRYFQDNTDYKKAWDYLMSKNLTVEYREFYENILKNSK